MSEILSLYRASAVYLYQLTKLTAWSIFTSLTREYPVKSHDISNFNHRAGVVELEVYDRSIRMKLSSRLFYVATLINGNNKLMS